MGRQKFSNHAFYAFLRSVTLYSSKRFRRETLLGRESVNVVLAGFQNARSVVGGTATPKARHAGSLEPGSFQ